jgi:hypothetical protein
MPTITRHNIDHLLDTGQLEIAMRNGNWWTLRRNGETKRWKRDPERIRIPIKAGLRVYDVIATYNCDLGLRGGHLLNSPYIRTKGSNT